MDKHRYRSYLDDGLFVVLIMVAAVASGAMEVGAILGAMAPIDAQQRAGEAREEPAPRPAQAAASSVDGAVLSAAAHRPAPPAR